MKARLKTMLWTVTSVLQMRLNRLLPGHIPIAFKLALVMTLLLVLGMASLGLFISNNQNLQMRAQLHDFGSTMAQQLAKLASEPILSEDSLNLRMLTANLDQDDKVLGAAIYAHNGDLLSAAGIQPGRADTVFDSARVVSRPWYRRAADRPRSD
ncbi:AhpA/YtjB family protein [Microbulbifer taiwanensis]|uniref:AhpA/YtjB family protein n=1 Tax=Microbulbifer taiwanensis TaxID=986746 RepID=UPI00361FB592